MGHLGLEYENGGSPPQKKGRKASLKGDETGCIEKIRSAKRV